MEPKSIPNTWARPIARRIDTKRPILKKNSGNPTTILVLGSVYIDFFKLHIHKTAYTHFFGGKLHIHIVYTFLKMTFQNLVFHCIPLLARRRRRQTVFFIAYSNFLSFLMLPDMISGLILLKYRIYTHQNFFQTAYTQNCIYTFFRRKTAYTHSMCICVYAYEDGYFETRR